MRGIACLSHLTVDYASLSRPNAVPTPYTDTSNVRALIAFSSCVTYQVPSVCFTYLIPFLFRRL